MTAIDLNCNKCRKSNVVTAKAVSMSFYTADDEEYVDYVDPDGLALFIDVCLECGRVDDAWLEEPHDNTKLTELRAENGRLRERVGALETGEWIFNKMGEAKIADLHIDYGNHMFAAYDFDGDFAVEADELSLIFEPRATAEGGE